MAGGQGARRWPWASGKLGTSPAVLPGSRISVGFWASCGGAAAPSPAGPWLEPRARSVLGTALQTEPPRPLARVREGSVRAPQPPWFYAFTPVLRPPPRCHSPARHCQPCPGNSTVLNKRVTVPNMLMGKCLRCSGCSFPASGNACAQKCLRTAAGGKSPCAGARGAASGPSAAGPLAPLRHRRIPQERGHPSGALPAAARLLWLGFTGMGAALGALSCSQAAMGQEQWWWILQVRICCEERLYLFSRTPALSRDLQRE